MDKMFMHNSVLTVNEIEKNKKNVWGSLGLYVVTLKNGRHFRVMASSPDKASQLVMQSLSIGENDPPKKPPPPLPKPNPPKPNPISPKRPKPKRGKRVTGTLVVEIGDKQLHQLLHGNRNLNSVRVTRFRKSHLNSRQPMRSANKMWRSNMRNLLLQKQDGQARSKKTRNENEDK